MIKNIPNFSFNIPNCGRRNSDYYMNPKISVIMPMYNVEKYVGLAIQSLLNQTFTDFEAIFIDDCSTDKTLEIAKSFNDPRIKIVENENNLGTPGAVRNIGIEIAKGNYLYFLDSDDVMVITCLETLYNVAKSASDVEFVSTINSLHAIDGEFQSLDNVKCKMIKAGIMGNVSSDLKQRIWEEYANHKIHCAVWLSLFKRSLFNGETANIRFRNFAIAEDDYFLFEILCATSNIIKIDKPIYIYRTRTESASHSFNVDKIKNYIQTIIEGSNLLEDKLSSLINDAVFVNIVNEKVTERLFNLFIMAIYIKDKFNTISALINALNDNSKKNNAFLKTLITAFVKQNLNLRELAAENTRLKYTMKSIKHLL